MVNAHVMLDCLPRPIGVGVGGFWATKEPETLSKL